MGRRLLTVSRSDISFGFSGLVDAVHFFRSALLLLLCLTALPAAKILFPDQVEAWILVFPIGFAVHAVGAFVGRFHFWDPSVDGYLLCRSGRIILGHLGIQTMA